MKEQELLLDDIHKMVVVYDELVVIGDCWNKKTRYSISSKPFKVI